MRTTTAGSFLSSPIPPLTAELLWHRTHAIHILHFRQAVFHPCPQMSPEVINIL